MLLYQHTQGHYLAVAPHMRFAPAAGYALCFDGHNVPDVICRAYVTEHGGNVIDDVDTIVLSDEPRRRCTAAAHAC